MKSLLVAALATFVAVAAFAQSPYLVTDLNISSAQGAQSSDAAGFTEAGGWVYFRARGDAGLELWKSDGTTTTQVKDIYPGLGSSAPYGFLHLGGGVLLFGASHPTYGTELWRTDGTEGGTMLVKDFAAGMSSSNAQPMAVLDGRAIVYTASSNFNQLLWATDGTEGGTELLVSDAVSHVTRMGSYVYFFAASSLYRTDGTAAGTTVVKAGVSARAVAVAGSKLFFAGWDQQHGYELWVSDGTESGTLLVKDINPGPGSAFLSTTSLSFATVGSSVVFWARDGVHNWTLWRSDGLEGNTVPYREFVNFGPSAVPPALTAGAGAAFFRMSDLLWRTDGAAIGTYAITGPVSPILLVGTPTRLYFGAASTGGGSTHLWSSDGTDAGTSQISSAAMIGGESALASGAGKVWFAGSTALAGSEPWVSDGTAAGTQMLGNLAADPPPSSNPGELRGAQEQLFFIATPGESYRLYRSDGTSGGTLELGQATTSSGYHSTWRNLLFFRAANDQLWRSDGTAGGTILLKDDISAGAVFAGSEAAYFSGKHPTQSFSDILWKSDGTVAGTTPLTGTASSQPTNPSAFAEIAGRAFMVANSAIWRTDGTDATTVRVPEAYDPYYSGGPSSLAAMGGAIYFTRSNGLWRLAGAGTEAPTLVSTLGSSGGNVTASQAVVAGSILYMIVSTSATGWELWRSDGTEAGTYLLKDIMPGSSSSNPTSLTALNGTLFFAANNGFDGVELWKSDGTTAGTVMVADIAPGAAWSSPESLVAADGRLWFSATNGASGVELWSSDGTSGGTAMVADLAAGSTSSTPRQLTVGENKLFFSAQTSAGRELWALQLSTASRFSIGDTRLVEGTGGTTNASLVITRGGDLSQPATVSFTTGGGTATAGSDYVAQSGVASFGAGVATATVQIVVNGDAADEGVETFLVTISNPSIGFIQRHVGAALIEDDDQQVALSIIPIQTLAESYYDGPRRFVVTNSGPSTATNVTLRVSESPFDVGSFYGSTAGCSADSRGVIVCALGALLPNQSRTITVPRTSTSASGRYYYDTTNIPGRTVTASVTAAEPESNLTDNSVAKMMSPDGTLMLPPFLTSGTNALVDWIRSQSTGSGLVTIFSSHASVVPTPSTIAAGTNAAQFTLQVGNVVGSTYLTTAASGYSPTGIVVPIVSAGQTPKLATALYTPYFSSINYGQTLKIPIRVAARKHDGTLPTGTLRVVGPGTEVTELTLDGNGAVEFTRANLNPGSYTFRAEYLGDANFSPIDRTLESVTVWGISTSAAIQVPRLVCGTEVPATFFVRTSSGSAGAPTGLVRVALNNGTPIDLTLVPTGKPGESSVSHNFPLPAGATSYSISGSYVPTGGFSGTTIWGTSAPAGCTSIVVEAVATAANRVTVTWTAAPGATLYEVYRMEGGYSSGNYIGYSPSTTFIDTTVQPDRCYLYRVRTSTSPALSQGDFATTVMFSDDPIVAGVTRIRQDHVLQLRTAVSAMRSLAGLSAPNYSTGVANGMPMTAQHTLELRQLLNEARTWIGKPTVTFAAPAPAAGQPVRAAQVQELRNAAK